jgi:hypothetical protein
MLQALHGGFFLEANGGGPAWFARGYAGGVFPGLPLFLSDVRPQGFIGRALAQAAGATLGVPVDPRNWQDDDILVYLLEQGDDGPGDFVVGEKMMERVLRRQVAVEGEAIADGERAGRYTGQALQAMQGGVPESSAGGEQPKFTAAVRNDAGGIRHVLVKFSPAGESPASRRWADLLAAEAHALEVAARQGVAAAQAGVLDAGGRRFLEVTRFDRSGAAGRRGVISLQAVEAGLLDETASDWNAMARAMETAGLFSAADAADLRRRWCFGQLIGNTDMHLGNAAVWFGVDEPFSLAPLYDMLPMLFAPGPQGELVSREFSPPPPLPAVREEWHAVVPWALAFWQQVQADMRISPEFRGLAGQAGETVEAMARRF